LTFNAKIHNVVAADGTVVHHNIPCPQRDGVPLLHLELLLGSFRFAGILLLLGLVTLGVLVVVFALSLHRSLSECSPLLWLLVVAVVLLSSVSLSFGQHLGSTGGCAGGCKGSRPIGPHGFCPSSFPFPTQTSGPLCGMGADGTCMWINGACRCHSGIPCDLRCGDTATKCCCDRNGVPRCAHC